MSVAKAEKCEKWTQNPFTSVLKYCVRIPEDGCVQLLLNNISLFERRDKARPD